MNDEIVIRERVIFDGNKGFEYDGKIYRLVVGASPAQSENGRLFCSWMSGTGGEPEQGHCAMYITSDDNGKTWSEPVVFVPPDEINGSGGLMNMDDRLYMLKARWPLEENYTKWYYTICESPDNGETWGEERKIEFWNGDYAEGAAHAGNLKLRDGSWLGISQLNMKRERPLKAPVEQLVYAKDEAEALSMPEGEEKPEYAYLNTYKEKLAGVGVFKCDNSFKDFEFLGMVCNRPLGLIEPTMVELSDGTLSLLMRAELGGFVWRSDSHDGGKTWEDAYETDIPSASTLCKAIRMPDDRIVLFLNPLGKKGERGSRSVLEVWVSDDDMKTWYLKKQVASGGYLSYPNTMILQNGQLIMCYEDRRQARFVEIDLPPARNK